MTEKIHTNTSFPSSTSSNVSDIRLTALLKKPLSFSGKLLCFFAPMIERLIGFNKLRAIYRSQQLSGLHKQTFTKQLIQGLRVNVVGKDKVLSKLPETGPCIVVCNHPHGMVDGVIMANLLNQSRNDIKILANEGLRLFKEIEDYFIFANPLKSNAAINPKALKQCFSHLNAGGLLVLFAAGRVSTYQKEKAFITDAPWNRLVVSLAEKSNAPILPVHISGGNSPLFHTLGRIYHRLRLVMLTREMFKLQGKTIVLSCNNLIDTKQLQAFKALPAKNDFIRAQCYLNAPDYVKPWQTNALPQTLEEIAPSISGQCLATELANLPAEQRLLSFKTFDVYYGYQSQIPQCVTEIARLREITFRTLDEGSGQPLDTDHFDALYLHLFIFDRKSNSIIGAYRLGETDKLQQAHGLNGLYLAQMFSFTQGFKNQQAPCLELGRSFIIEKHQNSFYGLMLLWKGIGAYVCKFPQYRTLYGTVSMSKTYDPRSIALIEQIMVTKPQGVKAKSAFAERLSPDVEHYIKQQPIDITQLSALITGIEPDKKDVPVLLKKYHKMGAVFHCMAVDRNFNNTPGLLLSVDFSRAPDKLLNLYLGAGKDEYLAYQA